MGLCLPSKANTQAASTGGAQEPPNAVDGHNEGPHQSDHLCTGRGAISLQPGLMDETLDVLEKRKKKPQWTQSTCFCIIALLFKFSYLLIGLFDTFLSITLVKISVPMNSIGILPLPSLELMF